jgi:hypothetical protein
MGSLPVAAAIVVENVTGTVCATPASRGQSATLLAVELGTSGFPSCKWIPVIKVAGVTN